MDVTAFSGDQFDPKDWINKTLRNADPSQSKEAVAGSLVMKLQLMIARLNTALEEQCAAVVTSVPRVIREAEQLKQEAGLLRDKMIAVKADIAMVEKETGDNMAALVKMDLAKERVVATSRALQEADNWTSLDNQVEDAFENDDYSSVAERLAGMQASLRLLSHVPDYQDRLQHLENHRNRLEATLSPLLVSAFNSLDTQSALQLVNMFRSMERHRQLTKYYHKCVRAGLLQKWSDIVNDTVGEGALEWSKALYEVLITGMQQHSEWAATVFPDENTAGVIADMVVDVLNSLDPSLDFCMEAALKLQQEPLQFLLDMRSNTEYFVAQLEPLIADASETKVRDVGRSVYSCYKPYIARYSQYETSTLQAEMASWSSSAGRDIIDEIQNLSSCVSKIVGAVEAAAGRCVALSRGTAFPGLATATAASLASHMDRYRKLMRRLEKRKGVVDDDWSILQHCLAANQATGDLFLQLEQLDMTLSLTFLDATRSFLGCESGEEPLGQHHVFLLESDSLVELSQLYTQVAARTGTATPILSQSLAELTSAAADLQKTTFEIMFHPISVQLEPLPDMEVWSSRAAGQGSLETDMPDFSFSPQEYITQIGSYLMTLPQHLEPYMSSDNTQLSRAFREAVFPGSAGKVEGESPADFLLGCIARSTCSRYQSYILKVGEVTPNSGRQLGVDIGYLGDILDDLGHPLTQDLASLMALLKLPSATYKVDSAGYPTRLVTAVRTLRGIDQ